MPASFEDADLRYRHTTTGDVGRFTGTEWIERAGRIVYEGSFAGGLVDQRGG